MSVNMKLLTLRDREELEERELVCDVELKLDADNELVSQLSGLCDEDCIVAFPIPDSAVLQYYRDGELVETRHTEVGGLLHFAYAGDFRKLERRRKKHKMRHLTNRNEAAIAYCAKLRKDTPVFLCSC